MKSLILRTLDFARRSRMHSRLFHGLIQPTASLPFFAAVLLTGCGSLPKAELQSLQAHCPNVLSVRRVPDIGGDTVTVRIKTSPTNSLELDAARTLKRLVASTNFATLPGPGRRLLAVTLRSQTAWIDGRESTYRIDNPKIQVWPNVLSLSDEEVSALAPRQNYLWTENGGHTYEPVPISLFMPLYDSKCSPWSGGHHHSHCK
jgi:hypothetical protein